MRALQANGQRPPLGRIVQPRGLHRWNRDRFAGIKPEKLKRILSDTERGLVEEWVDLCSFMVRMDAHLSSVYTTLIDSVSGADVEFVPGMARSGDAGEQRRAQRAADLAGIQFDELGDQASILAHLLHGEAVGWAAVEHDWRRDDLWLSFPHKVHARDIEFADDWTVKVRTFTEGAAGGRWLRVDEEHPLQFLVHIPGGIGETPNVAGLFQSVAWPWLLKRWATVFEQSALENAGSPHWLGRVRENAPKEVRAAMEEGLRNLSAEHFAVIEGERDATDIELREAQGKVAEGFERSINRQNDEMSKRLLGSTLNVENTSAVGSRAQAESQAEITTLPRLARMAERLGSSIQRQWLRHLTRLNTHYIGGPAPTPQMVVRLVQEEAPTIEPQDIAAGLEVTQDEYRAAKGLDPKGDERGGNRIVRPVAKRTPEVATEPSLDARSGEAGHPDPLPKRSAKSARQMRLPMTSRRTLRTSSRSPTLQIAHVPSGTSGDPAPPSSSR